MTANNAGTISNLESRADVEYSRRSLVMKDEHEEQVTRAEKNTASDNERMLALMRQEHHAILQAEKAKHSAVLQEQKEEAARNAARAQQAAALQLQRIEQMSAE
eukprot:3627373-Heterocapsa_arctica.AAC.1